MQNSIARIHRVGGAGYRGGSAFNAISNGSGSRWKRNGKRSGCRGWVSKTSGSGEEGGRAPRGPEKTWRGSARQRDLLPGRPVTPTRIRARPRADPGARSGSPIGLRLNFDSSSTLPVKVGATRSYSVRRFPKEFAQRPQIRERFPPSRGTQNPVGFTPREGSIP